MFETFRLDRAMQAAALGVLWYGASEIFNSEASKIPLEKNWQSLGKNVCWLAGTVGAAYTINKMVFDGEWGKLFPGFSISIGGIGPFAILMPHGLIGQTIRNLGGGAFVDWVTGIFYPKA